MIMVKNNSEIIAETDEDLQLQAGLQLSSAERQCLLQNGMLFMDLQRVKPYLAGIRCYLQDTQPAERVWTLFKVISTAVSDRTGYFPTDS